MVGGSAGSALWVDTFCGFPTDSNHILWFSWSAKVVESSAVDLEEG